MQNARVKNIFLSKRESLYLPFHRCRLTFSQVLSLISSSCVIPGKELSFLPMVNLAFQNYSIFLEDTFGPVLPVTRTGQLIQSVLFNLFH